MAQRVARMYGGAPILNIYEFDDADKNLTSLNVRRFNGPSEEWAKFVITNRNATKLTGSPKESNIDCKFDLVIGPIANDNLALLFRQFSEGTISVETLVNEIQKTYGPVFLPYRKINSSPKQKGDRPCLGKKFLQNLLLETSFRS